MSRPPGGRRDREIILAEIQAQQGQVPSPAPPVFVHPAGWSGVSLAGIAQQSFSFFGGRLYRLSPKTCIILLVSERYWFVSGQGAGRLFCWLRCAR
jgi:hypothetical protein